MAGDMPGAEGPRSRVVMPQSLSPPPSGPQPVPPSGRGLHRPQMPEGPWRSGGFNGRHDANYPLRGRGWQPARVLQNPFLIHSCGLYKELLPRPGSWEVTAASCSVFQDQAQGRGEPTPGPLGPKEECGGTPGLRPPNSTGATRCPTGHQVLAPALPWTL